MQSVGGHVNFSTGQQELLHRTFIYAPAVPGKEGKVGGEKYNLSAQMLDFPNTSQVNVQSWIPREIASYTTFNWNMQNAFAAVEPLADEYIDNENKGAFRDLLDNLRDDPNGAKIDIEKEIIANLGMRVTVLTDFQLPVTISCERSLYAFETTQDAPVAAGIQKMMQKEPDVKRHEYQGFIIWENSIKETKVEELVIESSFGDVQHSEMMEMEMTNYQPPKGKAGGKRRFGPNNNKNAKKPNAGMPGRSVAVCNGHLLVASHLEF